MALVRFTRDWRGFNKGDVRDILPGIADSYVNYARAAVFVTEEDEATESETGDASRPRGRPKGTVMTRRVDGPREAV